MNQGVHKSGSFRISGAVIIGLVVAVALVMWAYRNAGDDSAVSDTAGHVIVSPLLIDYGDIPQEQGVASKTVTVTNTGGEILEVHNLSTSCGCTTATMDMTDMDPGESRDMTITFDPMVHKDQLGEIIRVVYLQTSDPDNSEIEIDVIGNVMASDVQEE